MSNLSITLIQSDLHWEDAEANRALFDQKIAAMEQRSEIVVLPEMFSTGFSMQPEKLAEPMEGPTVQWMQRTARKYNIILTGSLIISENGHYFNRLLWVLPNGQTAHYDKRHLFAYAKEHEHYTPGRKKLIAQAKGWKICLTVCYDLRFPVWIRQPAVPEKRYDLLICVANWPEGRSTAWNTLLQARAIENQCYVAGVNRTGTDGHGIAYHGDSCVIDPVGEIMVKENKKEADINCTLQKDVIEKTRKQFPFLEDADRFLIL